MFKFILIPCKVSVNELKIICYFLKYANLKKKSHKRFDFN